MSSSPLDSYLALLGGSVLSGWLVATVMTQALKKESEIQSKYGSSTSQMFVGLGAAIAALFAVAITAVIAAATAIVANVLSYYRIYALLLVACIAGVGIEEFQYQGMPLLDMYSTTTTQPIYNEVFIPLGNTVRLAYNVSYCWVDVLGATYRTAIEDTFYTTIACDDVNWGSLVNKTLIALEVPFAAIAAFINSQGSEELDVRAMVTAIAQALTEFEPPLICFCENLSFLFNTFFVVINSPNLANAIHYFVNALIALSEAIIGLLTALFTDPLVATCNINRAPNLIPTVNYLTNSTVATFDLIDDITEALFVAFFGNIFCNATQFPQIGPILSRPLTALLQFAQIQLQILFHIDLVFTPSCDYLQYIQPNYVFYEGYAWSYGIEVFFDDFCWHLTTDLGCALAGTVNATLQIIQFVTLTGQVILVHPLTPIDTINFVKNYNLQAILNQTELATLCLSQMVEVLNLPFGQVVQYSFQAIEQVIYILLQLISNLDNLIGPGGYIQGAFRGDVDQFFTYLYAISISLGNVFRQFDTTVSPGCPLVNPLTPDAPLPQTFNIACCFGNSVQSFADIFISITDFVVILVIDIVSGVSFRNIYAPPPPCRNGQPAPCQSDLDFELAVIPALQGYFEALACIPASLFTIFSGNGQCPHSPALMQDVTANFGSTLGNLTTIPFSVLDTIFDLAYGLDICNPLTGDPYTTCIIPYICHMGLTMYDVTIGQLNFLIYALGQMVGCLMSGYLADLSNDIWSLYGWNVASGPITFKFRDELCKILDILITLFSFLAQFFTHPVAWLVSQLGAIATLLENKVLYAFDCVEGFFDFLFGCIKGFVEDALVNVIICIGCLGICHECHEISIGDCSSPNCTGNFSIGATSAHFSGPAGYRGSRHNSGRRNSIFSSTEKGHAYYVGDEHGMLSFESFKYNGNAVDVAEPCVAILNASINTYNIDAVRYSMMLIWEGCVVSSAAAHIISKILMSKHQLLLSPYTFIHPLQTLSLLYNLTRLPFYLVDELSKIPTSPSFNNTKFDPYNITQVERELGNANVSVGLWLNGTYIRNWLTYAQYYELDPLTTRIGFLMDALIRDALYGDMMDENEKNILYILVKLVFTGVQITKAHTGLFDMAKGAIRELSVASPMSAVTHVWNVVGVRNETKQMAMELSKGIANKIQSTFATLVDPVRNPNPQAAKNRQNLANIFYFTYYSFSDAFSGMPRGHSYARYLRGTESGYSYGYSPAPRSSVAPIFIETIENGTSVTMYNYTGVDYVPYEDSRRAVKGFVKSNLNRHRGLMRHPPLPRAEMGIEVFEESIDDTEYCFDNTTCLNCSVLQTYVTDMIDIIVHCIVKSEYGVIADPVAFAATPALTLDTHNLDLSGWSTSGQPLPPIDGSAGRLFLNVLSFLTFGKVNFIALIQNLNSFFLNTNPDESNSFLYWIQFIFVCNIDNAMVCDPSRGLGLYPAIYTLAIVFAVASIALSVAIPGASVFIVFMWGFFVFLIPVVAYEVGPRCLLPFPVPIFPDCLADDLFRVMMVFYADCFDWNRFFPGITTDACPGAAQGYTRAFQNCQAAPYNFNDGLRSWFFLLNWAWPSAFTWLTTSDVVYVVGFRNVGFISGDLDFPFTPGNPEPQAFIGCWILNIFQMLYPLAVLVPAFAAIFFFVVVVFALIWFILVALSTTALVVLDVISGSQGLSTKMGETYPIMGDHNIKSTVTPAPTVTGMKNTTASFVQRPPPPSYIARISTQMPQQPQETYMPTPVNYAARFVPSSSSSPYSISQSDMQYRANFYNVNSTENAEFRRRNVQQQPPSNYS